MDTIAEMLTRIRNAQMAGKADVLVRFSKLKWEIAKILEKEGFISLASKAQEEKFENIKIRLKYNKISNIKRVGAISGIKKISRSGQRIYVKKDEIRSVKNKLGLAIISTSRGVMSDREAKKQEVGGEYLCEVW